MEAWCASFWLCLQVRNYEVYRLMEESMKAMLTSLPLVQVGVFTALSTTAPEQTKPYMRQCITDAIMNTHAAASFTQDSQHHSFDIRKAA
jgi:hypothetical protein